MTESASDGKRSPGGLRHWLLRGLTSLGVLAIGYAPRDWWDNAGDAWWERGEAPGPPPSPAPRTPSEETGGAGETGGAAPDPRHAFIPVWHPER